jgi:uncharacterized membrane protein YvbJ
VAYACGTSYSGGRDQKDCGSKPTQANSSRDSISKKPITKKGLVEWFKVYMCILYIYIYGLLGPFPGL